MAYPISRCDTTIPAKRSAPSDTEHHRLSRSMTADDPHLLLNNLPPHPVPTSTRRRVNPDSLALRLGPEVVAELEHYVKPGVVEMPSFAIRQSIQMRFNVDRRHIYDWFHSKGLRVTKEDKRATVEQKTDAMRMHRRMRRGAVPVLPKERPHPKISAETPRSMPVESAPVVPTVIAPAAVPVAQEPKPAPPPPWKSTPANYLIRRLISTLNLPPRPPPGTSRTFRDSRIDDICPISEDTVLDRTQREAYYNTLARILGPADGIQEEVGSYKAHMDRQIAIYNERILPNDFSVHDPKAMVGVETCSPQLTNPVGNSSFLLGLELEHPSDDPAEDSVSCEPPAEMAACSVDDSNAWPSGIFPEFCDVSTTQHQRIVHVQHPQPKTVSFAPDHQSHMSSAFLFSQFTGPIFNSSSSSLAGALDEVLCLSLEAEQESRRKATMARTHVRRARAYSGGGGM